MGLTGDKAWIARLRRAGNIGQVMDDWANDGAKELAEVARDLVDEGGIPSPNHVVSAPGNPPNTDSGALSASIQPVDLPDIGHAAVTVGEEYGLYLELGTAKMAERPLLRPAARIMKKPLLLDAAARIRKATSKR